MSNDSQESPERIRRKWEDTLLQGKTAIFLILNGFAIQKPNLLIAIIITAMNFLWVLASIQAWIFISNLVKRSPRDGIQSLLNDLLGTRTIHLAFRATTIVAIYIPTVIYVGWLTYMSFIKAWITWIAMVGVIAFPFVILWILHIAIKKPQQ